MKRLLTAAIVVLALGGSPGITASTESMVQILEQIAANTGPRSAPYLNAGRLALIRAVPEPSGNPAQLATYLFILGNESVLAGESLQAVEALTRLRRLADEGTVSLQPQSRRRLAKLIALSYLRLGEQDNCIDNHNIDRCLLPIRGTGVHAVQRGSRGATATYQEILAADPNDLEARWLLNIAAMTLGEHPEGVPPEHLIPVSAFDSEFPLQRFPDIAAEVGLDVFGLAGGSVIDDFDGDGLLDIIASSWGLRDQLRYFRNAGDGTFVDLTESAGLSGIVGGLNASHADFNNDGWLDVLVLRGAWFGDAGQHPNSLLRNNGPNANGQITFSDVTEEAGVFSRRPTQVGIWADYDNDGWLDLFVGNETTANSKRYRPELFHNEGPGEDGRVTFTEVAAASGIDIAMPIKGAAWGDIDNDGLMDLYVSSNGEANLLYHNRGASDTGWQFVDIAKVTGVQRPIRSFPAWFWDYDNDGWEDIFAAGFTGGLDEIAAEYLGMPLDPSLFSRLYRNKGGDEAERIAFEDRTSQGLERVLITMGANFGDLDNDGWLDIYAATGTPDMEMLMPNRMLRNDAGHAFQDVTTAGGFGHLQKGHGIAFGDLDHDGDQDIYAVMGGAHSGDGFVNALFENPGGGRNWVSLELVGIECNRSAIGARIELEVLTPDGTRSLYRTVGTGGSFGSSTLRQEIGLGAGTAISRLEVRWPGSKEAEKFTGVEANGFFRLEQGKGRGVRLERPSFSLGGRQPATPGHHQHATPDPGTGSPAQPARH